MPLQFGVQLLPQQVTWNQWRDGWLRIDALGFDSNWSFDHVHAPRGNPDSDSFEGWVGMGALAALTPRAWTGMLVSPVTFRNPALMVKMATTLDHITGGKSIFGLGAGWHVNEHQAYGFGFPSAGERVSRLAEALEITHRMWNPAAQPASFDGKFYQLDHAFNNPAPVQTPHPPILVAGSGPLKRRRLITAGQALELLEAEATFLWIVASDMVRGIAPDAATKDRLIATAARIGALRLEVYA